MVSKLHSWWQKVKKPLEIAVVSIFVVGLIALIILGIHFQWDWTGFGPEMNEPKQHAKKLWDWLQLLIIPAVLAVGGYVFNLTTSRNEQESTKSRDQTERDIASDNQREAALQAYINKMSDLLLDRKLRVSEKDNEVRKIARVRTLTVLPRLDNARKSSILQFLYESDLLDKNKPILDLSGADLSGAVFVKINFSGADLSGADLSFANFIKTDLSETNLSRAIFIKTNLNEANLSGAYLIKATLVETTLVETNLSGADLSGADLSGAKNVTTEQLDKAKSLQKAIMADGSTHA
jgi:uncharacterized protein YjbI with pentapeptide repeats